MDVCLEQRNSLFLGFGGKEETNYTTWTLSGSYATHPETPDLTLDITNLI